MNLELAKLIEENPKLPIVYFVGDDNLGEYAWTFLTKYKVIKGIIYICDDRVFDDYDEAFDYIREYYSDYEEYSSLSDEEYDKVMKKKTKELEHYKAIIIWVE